MQSIFDEAHRLLGRYILSAMITTWSHPDEPDSATLLLTMTARVDRSEIRRARRALLAAIASEAPTWTDEERRDYSSFIDFELEPA